MEMVTVNKDSSKKAMRELTPKELEAVAGGIGGYVSWTFKNGLDWGLFMGSKPGKG